MKEAIGHSCLLKSTVICFGKDKQCSLLTSIRDCHSVWYSVRRVTVDPAQSVQSQRFSHLSWNSKHLLGIRRDFYRAYSDSGINKKKKRKEGNPQQNFGHGFNRRDKRRDDNEREKNSENKKEDYSTETEKSEKTISLKKICTIVG